MFIKMVLSMHLANCWTFLKIQSFFGVLKRQIELSAERFGGRQQPQWYHVRTVHWLRLGIAW